MHPLKVHYLFLLRNAETALTGPQSVAVGGDFWGEPNLRLRREAVPKISGVIRVRAMYANLANAEQSRAILREAMHDARAARVRARAAFVDNETPPMPRPVLSIRYVWIEIDWLERALRSLEDLCVPLAAPPDISPDETYTLGIWRPDLTSVQARWGVDTPGAFEALSARWQALWEQMADLLQHGEPVTPEEYWPLDAVPAYDQASSEPGVRDDTGGVAGHGQADSAET
jgi:hypothetical protein